MEIIQQYPDNVTYWDAKQQTKTVSRESRSYGGVVMVSTDEEVEVDEVLYSTGYDDEPEVEESVEEPVVEDQDVVVRFNDPDESMIQESKCNTPRTAEPPLLGWYDPVEDQLDYPYEVETSATQPNDPSM